LGGAVDWVAVDWGTSNMRAWGIGKGGETVFSLASESGMGRVKPADYPAVLSGLLAPHLPEDGRGLDVLICGMAGARQGWREAPYLDTPADLEGLAFGAVAPPMPSSSLSPRILPGVCQKQPGSEDVMRGEETQLLGLLALRPGFAGLALLPGTHCKWVSIAGSRIERFATAMTGELYDVLSTHTVLRHSLAAEIDPAEREAGFAEGLAEGIAAPGRLSGELFKVRSAALLSGRGPGWCAGLLSGLLIGAEIGAFRDWIEGGTVPLIGGAALCALYARGLAAIGVGSEIIDAATATLAGLKAARK
jgi:2-dehydro-3-deoxygalactonokinase